MFEKLKRHKNECKTLSVVCVAEEKRTVIYFKDCSRAELLIVTPSSLSSGGPLKNRVYSDHDP